MDSGSQLVASYGRGIGFVNIDVDLIEPYVTSHVARRQAATTWKQTLMATAIAMNILSAVPVKSNEGSTSPGQPASLRRRRPGLEIGNQAVRM